MDEQILFSEILIYHSSELLSAINGPNYLSFDEILYHVLSVNTGMYVRMSGNKANQDIPAAVASGAL